MSEEQQNAARPGKVVREDDVNARLRALVKEDGQDTPAGRALRSVSAGELGWGAVGAGGAGLLTWLLTGRRPGMSMTDRIISTAGGAGLGFLGGMALPSYLKDSATGMTMAQRMRLADLVATTSADDTMSRTVRDPSQGGGARVRSAPDRGRLDTVSDKVGLRPENREDAVSGSNLATVAGTTGAGAGAGYAGYKLVGKGADFLLDKDRGFLYGRQPTPANQASLDWGANQVRDVVDTRNQAIEGFVKDYDRRNKAGGGKGGGFGSLSVADQESLLKSWNLPGGTPVTDGGSLPLRIVHSPDGRRVWVDVDRQGMSWRRRGDLRYIPEVDTRTGRLDGKAWMDARARQIESRRTRHRYYAYPVQLLAGLLSGYYAGSRSNRLLNDVFRPTASGPDVNR